MFRGARLAIVEREAEPLTSGPPSIASIAAGVARTAKHERAEQALADLRAKRANHRHEATALAASAQSGTSTAIRRRAEAMEREAAQIEADIAAARQTLAPLRAAHKAAVADTLAGMSREASQAVLTALADLRAAVAVLDDIDAAMIAAGGGERCYLTMDRLAVVERVARRHLSR